MFLLKITHPNHNNAIHFHFIKHYDTNAFLKRPKGGKKHTMKKQPYVSVKHEFLKLIKLV